MATQNSRLIIGLTVVLLLVAGVSVWLLVFTPSGTDQILITDEGIDSGVDITSTTTGFNLKVLQRQAWQGLNKQLIEKTPEHFLRTTYKWVEIVETYDMKTRK